MNFIENDENGLLYANFNENKDCIIFGTTIGFYVYTCNPFKKIISRRIIGGTRLLTSCDNFCSPSRDDKNC